MNMNPRPMTAVDMLDRAVEILVVAPLLMICVSSDSLLKSSPVRVTSKKAISYKISTENSVFFFFSFKNYFFPSLEMKM